MLLVDEQKSITSVFTDVHHLLVLTWPSSLYKQSNKAASCKILMLNQIHLLYLYPRNHPRSNHQDHRTLRPKYIDYGLLPAVNSHPQLRKMDADSLPQHRDQKEEQKHASSHLEITLRPFDVSDTDDYFVWASDDKVTQWCSWDSYTKKEDLLKYMKDTVLSHPWFRAICLAGRPVGAISVAPAPGMDRCRGEMGYVLGSQWWGQGIVTAAVRMALQSVFQELDGLERVEALVDVVNKGSQRVMEKAGFTREGVLRKYCVMKGRARDMVMYSFISTDPLAK